MPASEKGFAPISLVLIVVSFVALLGVGYFLGALSRNKDYEPEITQQKTTDFNYKVAVKIGGYDNQSPPNLQADLWTMNPDGTNKKQITKTGDIYSVHDWSPNNKMVLVVQGSNRTISAVDVSSGSIKLIKQPECLMGQYHWLSDTEILVIEPSCTDETISKIEKVSLDGNTETLLTFPKDGSEFSKTFDLSSATVRLSQDRIWLAFDKKPCCEGPLFTPQLYVYNLKDKSKKMILESSGLNLLDWNKDKIVFTRNENEIWEVNSDGSELNKVLEDKEPIEHSSTAGRIFNAQASKDGTYLLYGRDVGWEQYYLSHFTSGQKIPVVKQLFNDRPQYVSLAPDNSFIVYAQRSGTHDETKEPIVCFTQFIRQDYPTKLTTENCEYPSISN